MKHRKNFLWIQITVFCIYQFCYSPAGAQTNAMPAGFEVKVEEGLLTASVRAVPLIDILEEIAEQTGIGIEVHVAADERMTAKYSKIPLEVGLKRLLSSYNVILTYTDKDSSSPQGKIKSLIVYDTSGRGGGQQINRQLSGGSMQVQRKRDSNPRQGRQEEDTAKPDSNDYAAQLDDGDPEIREEAVVDMVDELQEAALPQLEKVLLNDGNDEIRSVAAEEIGNLESKQGIAILSKGLNDPDEDVREAVVDALGAIGGKESLPALRQALNDKSETIRETAAILIEDIEEETRDD